MKKLCRIVSVLTALTVMTVSFSSVSFAAVKGKGAVKAVAVSESPASENTDSSEVLTGPGDVKKSSKTTTTLTGTAPKTNWSTLSAARKKTVEMARSLLTQNISYTSGGNTPDQGLDCSGFCLYCLKQGGISLNARASYDIAATAGKKIASKDMKPGDLVCYDGSPAGNGLVNHVAVYIGDGKIAHAIGTGRGLGTAAWDYETPMAILNVFGD